MLRLSTTVCRNCNRRSGPETHVRDREGLRPDQHGVLVAALRLLQKYLQPSPMNNFGPFGPPLHLQQERGLDTAGGHLTGT